MRLIGVALRNYFVLLAIIIIASLGGGCSVYGPKDDPAPPPSLEPGPTDQEQSRTPLRVGEPIRVDFSGTPTGLPYVQTEIRGDGFVHFDYIGDIKAAGKTPAEFEKEIQNAYVPAYYTHLSVTVTPAARYFFVDGEVTMSGRILYEGPITVTRAIAAAGGFNPFADRRHVRLYRVNATKGIVVNCIKALDDTKLDLPVYPGDKVVVKRRLY
jgi:polysaccharide biosynthesis/export protein VpsN